MKRGWEIKNLGDVLKLEYGKPLPKECRCDDGCFPVYGANGIKCRTNDALCKDPSIVVGRKGSAGELNLVDGAFWPLDVTYYVVVDRQNYDLKFIYFMLSQLQLPSMAKGVKPRLNRNDVYMIKQAFPPLPEQKRIVAILDKAFAAIAKAKANAEQNLKNAKELFESYLQEVFENKSEGWEEKKLGDVANTNGRIGWKGLTAKEYTEEGPLFLSVHSLNYGDYVDFSQAFHITQKRYDESPEIMLKKDDILICKDGAGIGKLGIVPELHDVCTINSSLLLIRCKKNVFTKYLYYNLLSPVFQRIVQSRLSGATTPHLYQRDIVTFPILLPPLSAQQAIVKKLDALSAETKRLEVIYRQKIEDLEELKKSILQKAFNGELTDKEIAL